MSALLRSAGLPVLLLLAATFVFAGVAAGSNQYQTAKNYDVSHLWESRERLATLLGYAGLAFAPAAPAARYGTAAGPVGLGFGACPCPFGLHFDSRLNRRRGLQRDYRGTDPQTTAQDKTVRACGLGGQQWAYLKLAGVVLLTVGLVWLRAKMLMQ